MEVDPAACWLHICKAQEHMFGLRVQGALILPIVSCVYLHVGQLREACSALPSTSCGQPVGNLRNL